MSWMPPALYKTNCPIKVDLFPYDRQVCNIEFRSFYNFDEVQLQHTGFMTEPSWGSKEITNFTRNAAIESLECCKSPDSRML